MTTWGVTTKSGAVVYVTAEAMDAAEPWLLFYVGERIVGRFILVDLTGWWEVLADAAE